MLRIVNRSVIALGAEEQNARMRLDTGSEIELPLSEIRKAKLVLTDSLIDACSHMVNALSGSETE